MYQLIADLDLSKSISSKYYLYVRNSRWFICKSLYDNTTCYVSSTVFGRIPVSENKTLFDDYDWKYKARNGQNLTMDVINVVQMKSSDKRKVMNICKNAKLQSLRDKLRGSLLKYEFNEYLQSSDICIYNISIPLVPATSGFYIKSPNKHNNKDLYIQVCDTAFNSKIKNNYIYYDGNDVMIGNKLGKSWKVHGTYNSLKYSSLGKVQWELFNTSRHVYERHRCNVTIFDKKRMNDLVDHIITINEKKENKIRNDQKLLKQLRYYPEIIQGPQQNKMACWLDSVKVLLLLSEAGYKTIGKILINLTFDQINKLYFSCQCTHECEIDQNTQLLRCTLKDHKHCIDSHRITRHQYHTNYPCYSHYFNKNYNDFLNLILIIKKTYYYSLLGEKTRSNDIRENININKCSNHETNLPNRYCFDNYLKTSNQCQELMKPDTFNHQ